jgi:hypothetical protein
MAYPQEQIEELKPYCASVSECEDGGRTYFLLEGLILPEGCTPSPVDALLCPTPRDSYQARLYFPHQVQGHYPRNWNGSAHICGRNWVAYSWQLNQTGLRLVEVFRELLAGLTRQQ